jgi:Fe2+ transport system protein FeoA
MQEKKLSDLVPGESGVVVSLGSSSLTPRLAEMGLLKGKIVTVLFQAPFSGPLAVDVEGYTLSLRREEAEIVAITHEEVKSL